MKKSDGFFMAGWIGMIASATMLVISGRKDVEEKLVDVAEGKYNYYDIKEKDTIYRFDVKED